MITMQFTSSRHIYSLGFFFHEEEIIHKRERATRKFPPSGWNTKSGEGRKELWIIRQIERTRKRKFGKFNCLDGPQTKRNDRRSITGSRVPKFVNTNNRARLSVTRCVTRFNSALTTEWGGRGRWENAGCECVLTQTRWLILPHSFEPSSRYSFTVNEKSTVPWIIASTLLHTLHPLILPSSPERKIIFDDTPRRIIVRSSSIINFLPKGGDKTTPLSLPPHPFVQ